MSVGVDLSALGQQIASFGSSPFLLTVTDDARCHAVSVRVAWNGESFGLRVGTKTLANLTAHPEVTLLWAPLDGGPFSLIVDGTAEAIEDQVTIRPSSALLHRTLARTAEDPAGSDCVAVLKP